MVNTIMALFKTAAICLSSTAIIGGIVVTAAVTINLISGVAAYRIAAAA